MSNHRDALPPGMRAKAQHVTRRYRELREQQQKLWLSSSSGGLPRPGKGPTRQQPSDSLSSSSSSSSSSSCSSADEDEDDDDDDSIHSDDMEIDPIDRSDYKPGPMSEDEGDDNVALVSSDSEADVPDVDPDGMDVDGDGEDEDEDEDEDGNGDEDAVQVPAAAPAPEADLEGSHCPALALFIDDHAAQDTMRTVLARYGYPPEVVAAITPEIERNLAFSLRVVREHVIRILTSSPVGANGTNINMALEARAKNSRDLRHALDYKNGLRQRVRDRLLALTDFNKK